MSLKTTIQGLLTGLIIGLVYLVVDGQTTFAIILSDTKDIFRSEAGRYLLVGFTLIGGVYVSKILIKYNDKKFEEAIEKKRKEEQK